MTIKVVISGASGRMGRRLVALAQPRADMQVVGAITRPGDEQLGRDAGEIAGIGAIGVKLSDQYQADSALPADVWIDFSTPAGLQASLASCVSHRIPIVTGTTGLNAKDEEQLASAAHQIPVLHATNTSLGVAVLNRIAAEMTRMLGPEFDIEIVESHHNKKKDAPSGTAKTLAQHILRAAGRDQSSLVLGRSGDDATRQRGSVGMHSLRMGDVVGIHTVHFAADGERLELTHAASSRDTFAHGALRAANWIVGKPAGRYSIEDVVLGAR